MHHKQYEGKKGLVLGLGISGRAAAEFLLKRGASVWGVDQSQELLNQHEKIIQLKGMGLKVLHESLLEEASGFDFAIVSPGVPPANALYQKLQAAQVEIMGEVELACRSLKQPLLAITGSNGKTTTTLLTEHVLNHCGIAARALGNVGIPLTLALDEAGFSPSTVVVAELSSWQLETLNCPIADSAVILNLTPNHLDRHKTIENYANAKFRIKNCLKSGKSLYLGWQVHRDFQHLLGHFKAKTFGFYLECDIFCNKESVALNDKVEFILPLEYRGVASHHVENIMAAFALCHEMGVSGEQFCASLASFKRPPHRIEFVKEVARVAYFNDSKGTNLDAVIKSVQSMKGQVILIAGGVHKGSAYTPWLEAFAGKVRCVCAIGEAAGKIKEDLGSEISVEKFSSLEEAVRYASQEAKEGENVLLSPGCASYDMFKNYEERGDEFKRIVSAMQETL